MPSYVEQLASQSESPLRGELVKGLSIKHLDEEQIAAVAQYAQAFINDDPDPNSFDDYQRTSRKLSDIAGDEGGMLTDELYD